MVATLSWLWELSIFLFLGPLCGLLGGHRLRNHSTMGCGLDFSSRSSELHLSRLSQESFIHFLEPTKVESPE